MHKINIYWQSVIKMYDVYSVQSNNRLFPMLQSIWGNNIGSIKQQNSQMETDHDHMWHWSSALRQTQLNPRLALAKVARQWQSLVKARDVINTVLSIVIKSHANLDAKNDHGNRFRLIWWISQRNKAYDILN